jgi:hypothetical protein
MNAEVDIARSFSLLSDDLEAQNGLLSLRNAYFANSYL